MKIFFLVPRLDKASTRFRVIQYLPYLERAGWSCEIKTLSRTNRSWASMLGRLRSADVVFVQKKLFTLPELWLIRRFARRVVYDFDDAVMFKERAQHEDSHQRQFKRFVRTLQNTDVVIAGNCFLAEYARRFHPHVTILPTPVDTSHYLPRTTSTVKNEVVIGWIGSRGTLKYLATIRSALERLVLSCPQVRLKIVADAFISMENISVIEKKWAEGDEVTDLQSFDIGIMPLVDDLWTRGKCGFKLLQCMATGLPVVCSPVGANTDIVTDGHEGFWADCEEAWVEKLRTLVKDAALRQRMGQLARHKVEQRYSLHACAPRFEALLRQESGTLEPQ